jgi:hypothetical protein
MKLIASIVFIVTIHFCSGQTNVLSEKFLSNHSDKYTQEVLNDSKQYYRLLLPLRKFASNSQAIELKSKTVHANKNSRFQERYQKIGFYTFEYANKKTCKLSVDTLLQCFPNFCVKVERGTPSTEKIAPSVYIINDKAVYCMETFCEDVNEHWDEVWKNFVDTFADNNSIIIFSECGELEWTNKEKLTH